ncbi:hypothetical protein WJX77_009903 [Trebouxia sp. C0004]
MICWLDVSQAAITALSSDTQSDAAWRLEVTESLKALLNQPSKAILPQDFSRVGSTQANAILASLEIVECEGNVLDAIVVSIAPHGLSIASAANQLRVAYEHQQSSAQKQRCREHCGDIAQDKIQAGGLTYSGIEKGQSVIATLGAYAYNAWPLLLDLTDGQVHHLIMIHTDELIYWDNLTPQQAYVKQSEVLLSSASLVDRKLKMTSIPDDLQQILKSCESFRLLTEQNLNFSADKVFGEASPMADKLAKTEAAGRFDDMSLTWRSSASFLMTYGKVLPCSKQSCHDWLVCALTHPGEAMCRREPTRFAYTGIACPDKKESQDEHCKRCKSYPYLHNTFEYWLHPTRYHTQLCQTGAQCSRPVCFFAHSSAELKEPTWGTSLPQDVLATARLAVSAEVARQNMVNATQDLSAQQALGKAVALAVADTFTLRQAAINPALNILSSNAIAADLLVELLAKIHRRLWQWHPLERRGSASARQQREELHPQPFCAESHNHGLCRL